MDLMPGETQAGSVVVENDGTSPLRYSVNTSSTDASSPAGAALYTALTIEVKTLGTDCATWDGTLLNTAGEILGASNVLFGTPSSTDGTGDRPLAGLANETLCFQVTLPSATNDTFQGASSVTTFTFNAEQSENN
jgi:hypothetical protein